MNYKGTAFESAIVEALVDGLQDDRIERRALCGAHDRGDIAGVRVRNHRLVLECKNEAAGKVFKLPGWTEEAHLEAENDHAIAGVVIHKRSKTTDARKQWVTMTVADLIAILRAANGN
jgi:hypothetical protein